MTSVRTVVNTTYVKFNKMYEPYPRVNTSSETKTSHRDVDTSNGPDIQQPKIGWKTFPVCKKLGTVDRKPMGLASSVKVQIRACSNTLAGETSAQNTVLHQRADKDLDGDQGAVGQRGNKGGNTLCRKLCFSNLSSGKERRGAETGNKSEVPEFLCENRTFQDGRSTHISPPHPAKRLDDKNGLEGCILSSSNPPGEPTPPPVSMGRQNLSITVSPISTDISPQGLLKGDEACGGNPQAYGNSSSDIPRRPLDTALGEGRADTVHSFNFTTV